MTVYGYIRVSTDDQVDNTSFRITQPKRIQGLGLANDYDDVDVWLRDTGVSGAIDFLERPALREIELKEGDVILCAALDRFSRDARSCLNTVHKFKEIGVKLIINGHGVVTDPSNLTGTLLLEVMAVFTGYERRRIRERMIAGKQAKKAAGGHIGGKVPWGCYLDDDRNVLELGQRELAFEKMREYWSEGTSLRDIAAKISEDYQISTSYQTVRRLMYTVDEEKAKNEAA
jgi:DNA invertase Pin-like site-specific DNA recombinase